MTDFYKSVTDATQNAMKQAASAQDNVEIDAINHLMAQKREHGDGSTSWAVRMSDSFDMDFLTHLSDSIYDCVGSAADVAARIEAMWDEDWTEIQGGNVVGDFSVGSSDFTTRSELET